MADQQSKQDDIFKLFISKVEEAVGLVALIPDHQKKEVWNFWEMITDTIKLFTKCVISLEQNNDDGQIHKKKVESLSTDAASIIGETDDGDKQYQLREQENMSDNEADVQVVKIDLPCTISQQIHTSETTQSSSGTYVSSSVPCENVVNESLPHHSNTAFGSTFTNDQSLEVSQEECGDDMNDTADLSDTNNYGEELKAQEKMPQECQEKSVMFMTSLLNKSLLSKPDSSASYTTYPCLENVRGNILTPEKLEVLLNTVPKKSKSRNKGKVATKKKPNILSSRNRQHISTSEVKENNDLNKDDIPATVEVIQKTQDQNELTTVDEQIADSDKVVEFTEVHLIDIPGTPCQDKEINITVEVITDNEENNGGDCKITPPKRKSSRVIKSKRNFELIEGDILTPEKLSEFLKNEKINNELKNQDDISDLPMDHDYGEVKKTRKRKRRSIWPRTLTRTPKRPRNVGPREKAEPVNLTCNECGVKLSNHGALLVHMRKHSGARPFPCKECGKSFTTKQNMQRHLLSHTGQKPFQCDTCDKCFTEKKSLNIHMRTHTGERPYVCDICQKTFTQSIVLQTHMQIHTGDKKHLCELCGKAFTQRTNLISHKKRHTENRRHDCTECNYSFFTKGELDRHILRHSGEKPFQCDICPKRFTRQQYLNEHLNLHLGNKPYSCNKCEEKFHDLSTYHRHLKKHKPKKGKGDKEEEVEDTTAIDAAKEVQDTNETTHYVMDTHNLLGQDALQQLQAVINQEVPPGQQYQTVILKGSSAQPVESLLEGVEGAVEVKDSNDQVYQITMVDQSQEVVATVDFSAFNLLANATAKQYSVSQ